MLLIWLGAPSSNHFVAFLINMSYQDPVEGALNFKLTLLGET